MLAGNVVGKPWGWLKKAIRPAGKPVGKPVEKGVSGLESAVTRQARVFAIIIERVYQRKRMTAHLTYTARAARHLSLGVRLTDPTRISDAIKLAEPLALHANVEAVQAQRVEGLIYYQFQLKQGLWVDYDRSNVKGLGVGLAEGEKQVDILLNDDAPHKLFAGTTGSGKTEGVKSALVALMTSYTPDKLRTAIVDPKADYQAFAGCSHLARPIATNPDETRNVLRWAYQQLVERKKLREQDIFAFDRDVAEGRIYRIVIAIDEADDDIALAREDNLRVVQILTKQGRAFGIHVIVGIQKPTADNLPLILDNLADRFVGRVTDANLSARISGQAGLLAHKLTGRGDFIHVNGDDSVRFQVALARSQDINRLGRNESRVETVPVEVEILDLPEEVAPGPGRPKNEVQPGYLAKYVHYLPQNISIARAKEEFGLSRDMHNLHKTFCLDFLESLEVLRNG